jgi:pyruvate/2-oxoglutarate dehydrogenase complex dihydrolipoamide acyltransferase (E2) component
MRPRFYAPRVSKRTKIRGWRKITSATWGHPNDPQIYGDLEIDATESLAFIERARAAGVKLTMTHMAGKAIGYSLGQNPDLNVRMYRSHFVHRDTVDIFFIVSMGAGSELSGVKVERADEKPVVEIAKELSGRAGRIRNEEDVEFGKTKRMLDRTPRRLLGVSLKVAAWLTADRDMDLKKQGLPRQAFGSAMVSSVGMFGIQHAYAPLSPYYRIPFLILVGEVAQKPVVIDGQIVARPMITISATMDHRYLDGFHAARLAKSARAYLEDPAAYEPEI